MNVFDYGRYKKQIDEATDRRTSRFGYENVIRDELNGYTVEQGKAIKSAGDCIDGRTYTDISQAEVDTLDKLLADYYNRQHIRTRYVRDNIIYIRKEKEADTDTESNRQEESNGADIDGVINDEMLDGYNFETDLDGLQDVITNQYSNQ
jgi:hypothetical protein